MSSAPTVKGPGPSVARAPALESIRYQAILDTARDAIISIDRNGLVTDYNDAAVAMFGYSAGEVVGRNVAMLMPSPYHEEHDSYLRAYQRTGEKKAIGRIRYVEAKRKSGDVFPMELSVSEARIGNEVLYTAIIRDVSPLRRAEAWAEARHDVTRTLAICDTLAEAAAPLVEIVRKIGGWDAGELWTVRRASTGIDPAAEELRYDGAAVAPGLRAVDFDESAFDGFRFALGEGLLGRAWAAGEPVSSVDVATDPSFVRPRLATTASLRAGIAFPIRDERTTIAVMGFYSRGVHPADEDCVRLVNSIARQIGDFIAHRRVEEEVRKLETLTHERERLSDIGAITTRLVHDLGNPLSGISMQAELLQRKLLRGDAVPAGLLQSVERILAGIARLRDLVRGFTDFAREKRLDLSSIDLNLFVSDLGEHWRPVAEERRVQVVTAIAEGLPPLIGDEPKLRRVFDNLVKNAVEAIEDGHGLVRIEARGTDDGRIRIVVSDSGLGISPGVEVFKLFETTKPLGTGIGLPVSKEIVQAHGGVIEFAPNTPRGTVFTVELPVAGPSGAAV